MTRDIALVLAILLGAVALFVSARVRMDLVALMVLLAVALTGLVTPTEAFAGFSSSAVITVWAMFIISGGLTLTGVAAVLGRRVMRVAGTGEARLVVAIMVTSGGLSAFMNNVGVAAMMLPVVVDIARRTGHAPSRLLMPMSLGALLGGLTTLIGTPPNILVAGAIRDAGIEPVGLFDFAPVGLPVLAAGIAFVALVGRHLLPHRDPLGEARGRGKAPATLFELGERLLTVRIPAASPLDGCSLGASRLGSALGLTVVAVLRNGRTVPAPGPGTMLMAGDRLLALGRPERVEEVCRAVLLERGDEAGAGAPSVAAGLLEARVVPDGPLSGTTLLAAGLGVKHGVHVLAVRRGETVRLDDLPRSRLEAGDVLLLHRPGTSESPLNIPGLVPTPAPSGGAALLEAYGLRKRLMTLTVPEGSFLAGRTLGESRLRDALGLTIWEIRRGEQTRFLPGPEDGLEAGDVLFVLGKTETLRILSGLRELEIESHPIEDLAGLESTRIGLSEIVLSPGTSLEGKTPRELEFRDRYGLTVLAVWRLGEVHRSELRDLPLRFGDAILVHGPRERLRLLAGDPDFLVVSEPEPSPPRREKAVVAVAILAAVLLPVLLGWIPISIAAVTGAVLMVLTRCLSMEDAYRHIEWPAVFLIAGMLPLGLAMERTGAADLLAGGMVEMIGGFGPRAVMAGLYLMTALGALVVPPTALVLLFAPITLTAAAGLGVSPLPLMMALAFGAASLASPVSHPANTLVMGPGGYRFVDYLKVGIPLTLLSFVLVVVLVPIFWPFVP